MQFIHQPAASSRLGDFLRVNLEGPWTSFRAAIAFVKRSGTRHVVALLSDFARKNKVEIIAGIDHRGTSQEGLGDLLTAAGSTGRVIVFHNRLPFTFHPKVYLFKSENAAELLVGSGNLTEGGLFTNYEASVRLRLNLDDPTHCALLKSVEDVLDAWANPTNGTALLLDAAFLAKLGALGLVPTEILAAPEEAEEQIEQSGEVNGRASRSTEPAESPFAAYPEPRAPSAPQLPTKQVKRRPPLPLPSATIRAASAAAGPTGFVMTLQRTDVGVGQTTIGTSRRSPEVFVPLSARDAAPQFWGWPSGFIEDRKKPGKFDRHGVLMRIGADIVSVNMMTWPDKHDFRLRSEALRSAGNVGDIIRIEKVDSKSGFDYYVEIIPNDTTQYSVYLALCTQSVRNSKKTYGYY